MLTKYIRSARCTPRHKAWRQGHSLTLGRGECHDQWPMLKKSKEECFTSQAVGAGCCCWPPRPHCLWECRDGVASAPVAGGPVFPVLLQVSLSWPDNDQTFPPLSTLTFKADKTLQHTVYKTFKLLFGHALNLDPASPLAIWFMDFFNGGWKRCNQCHATDHNTQNIALGVKSRILFLKSFIFITALSKHLQCTNLFNFPWIPSCQSISVDELNTQRVTNTLTPTVWYFHRKDSVHNIRWII